ncbi:uncharacterized protein CPUR_03450 [Claviceps purpurea 20.1]|uniref:Uncharacterized protein n=1 Tax=Claviceps purpurea (strain 20.1) TaxID=1111077 RepID=M1W938_CLAP2|nr:uncharacterized protein CPUR_03450 [Claviceps purpurea 20.1]
MPIRPLLTTSQPIANLASSPKHGMATIPRQKRLSEHGRRLSQLVSKFEILDSSSRQSKLRLTKRSNLPGGNESTLELNRPPSSISSASAQSVHQNATSEQLGNFPASGEFAREDEYVTEEVRVSLVAERRKLFEVNLGDVKLNARVNAHHASSRPLKQAPRLPTWQTLRLKSPSPCMAQSQTAVLSRPTMPNVSERLAGYLPLSSTCPSLPHVQTGTQPHTLSDCVQRCMQEARLDDDWTSVVTPGPSNPAPTLISKGKQIQTHERLSPNEEEAPDEGQQTPHAAAEVFETMPPSRRFGDGDLTASNRRSTSTDEVVHHGAAATRTTKSTRSNEVGTMYKRSCGTEMEQGGSNGDATNMNLTSHQARSSNSPARSPKQKHVVAGPRKPRNPPRISNTIEHFEALIIGDGLDDKLKSSIRLPKRLTGSSSCHLSKAEGKTPTGAIESARRKFSNSWGPARFRKNRVACGSSDARQPQHSDAPSYKRSNDDGPTDGTLQRRSPAPENWLARFHPNRKMNTSHVAHAQISKTRGMPSGRLRPRGPRPQPTPMIVARDGASRPGERAADGPDVRAAKDGHGSWRSRKRWVSRSSVPLVAQADCALQQPKPIRVNEVRRLVSLCRDRMTARKNRAQTD